MSVPVLYNRCYGGFNLSPAAVALYNERAASSGAPGLSHVSMAVDVPRTDRIMAKVVEEMGPPASGYLAKVGVAFVDEKFEDFVKIHEYDGFESVGIDFKGYKLCKIQEIVQSEEEDAMKLANISSILNEDEPTVKTD